MRKIRKIRKIKFFVFIHESTRKLFELYPKEFQLVGVDKSLLQLVDYDSFKIDKNCHIDLFNKDGKETAHIVDFCDLIFITQRNEDNLILRTIRVQHNCCFEIHEFYENNKIKSRKHCSNGYIDTFVKFDKKGENTDYFDWSNDFESITLKNGKQISRAIKNKKSYAFKDLIEEFKIEK